jgi:cyclic pyranopterin phosphate synthase
MNFKMKDIFGREFSDLRISVTDRCNLRCVYCMPKEHFGPDYPFLKMSELLPFEEITRLSRIFTSLGLRKIRITGGEPLIRRSIEDLIVSLAEISDLELTMTTNGTLLSGKAALLKKSGLDRITVSLDALDDEIFMAMNDVGMPVQQVLEGIRAAEDAGLTPIKINMVVKKGVNETSVLPMARFFRGTGHILRFIEYMDVGNTNAWRLDEVIPAVKIVKLIHDEFPIESLEPNYPGEVARRWRYKDGGGEIGIIASVTQPFCGDCSRARLSAEGKLYTCLFATEGHDLRSLIQAGASDEEIQNSIVDLWKRRKDRYSEERNGGKQSVKKIEMSYIGG